MPGSTTYSLVLYYMMSTPIEEHPLLVSFVNGDDAYRNSRFKLIPYISKVSVKDYSTSFLDSFILCLSNVFIPDFWFCDIIRALG